MYKTGMGTYLIIGNSNTRKASLIRSLTGCFNRSVRDILIQGARSPMRCYARVGALQDTSTTGGGEFIAEATRTRCQAVICCLVPSKIHKSGFDQNDAQSYVAEFRAAGWRIKAVAIGRAHV